MYSYSPSTGGMYSTDINGSNIPDDAIGITDEERIEFCEGLSQGQVIRIDDNGKPVLCAAAPYKRTKEEITGDRRMAYADPLNGSDRYFVESVRMQAMNEAGWEEVQAAGISRFKEIRAAIPWG